MDIIKKLIKLNYKQLDDKLTFLIDKSREMRTKILKPIDNNTKLT